MPPSRSPLVASVCFLLIFLGILGVAFAVDGKWSEWWEWEPCPASCGKGIRKRFRLCNNPPKSNGGADCSGPGIESEECEVPLRCPGDGAWSEWSEWTECTVTCGEGTKTRFRDCDSPPPLNGGRDCEGSDEETVKCVSTRECPRDGQWSKWGQWSACSVTCGSDGSSSRYRDCNNPPPSNGGKHCPGSNKGTRRCRAPECPINGHWSEWSGWTPCSVTCGAGVRMRFRKCDDPPPQNGGLDCSRVEAGEMQELSCNASIVFCPVNGGWSAWRDKGNCTTPECGLPNAVSYQIRERSCSNPYPAHKGSMCQGTFLTAVLCDVPVNCPVDGEWGEWSEWKCQPTSVTRERKCDSPPPSNGGKQCVGEKVETYLDEDEAYEELCADFVPEGDDYEDENELKEEKVDHDNEEEEEDEEEEEEED